ncbi:MULTISPECIES: elongation factor G [unclassified Bdellovibrio]|uniref:elongation factor G n=1 Tax=unclassified Bdellovibrio TaxID=2633795 RepID=UPI001159161D|nr:MULTISPECIES: elongation factor G [unclassified Bdellovibrio]QDK46438.1 elongation factor G [Bdellovibrio sp. ZAP7]QLY24620.1 elongation factor G [Bdellovibrio sp. KM01]
MSKKWNIDMVRNIGISAHIDSGKTTTSERILFYGGRIHAIHEVRGKDGVGATMDSMDLEREKGITIQSAATQVHWKDYTINLIDTPGHVDFTVEVERSLRVLDGAILLLCGVAGVQSQSITVDRQMKRYNVPRLAFVNKLDRQGANPYRVTDALIEKLRLNAVMIQIPIGLEDQHRGHVDLTDMKAYINEGDNGENVNVTEIPPDLVETAQKYRQIMIGKLADVDSAIEEKFLMEEEPTTEEIRAAIRKGTISLKLVPVLCGSAFKNKGVQRLMDAVTYYLPSPAEKKEQALDLNKNEEKFDLFPDPAKPLVALAFKLQETPFGQLTYMRVYQGKMGKGDFIINQVNKKSVKIPRLVRMHSDKMEDIDVSYAGDIVALFGIDCASGDTFCDDRIQASMQSMHVPDAVISLAVAPKDKTAANNFSKALQKFRKEDPTFRVARDEESNETIISGMGELHLEIYVERMKREFNCEVIVGQPQVAYRETISAAADYDYTHKKQTGGSGQYAKIVGKILPLPPQEDGAVFKFDNKVVGGRIPKEFIPAVEEGFKEQTVKGPLIGFPIVGVEVQLEDGAYHDVDSSYMAFKIAAMAALREVYPQAKPTVLEPIMKLETVVPDEYQGSAVGQINQRRGSIVGTTAFDGNCVIEAEVPLTEMFGYSTDLRSATKGKGEFSMEFAKYAAVPRNIQEELVKKYQAKRAAEQK